MKVLVTGAGGFVGNMVCRNLLDNGYKVRAMDNFHKGHCDALLNLVTNDSFEFVYGDVTTHNDVVKALKGVDAVIHLAAIVGFPACARQLSLSQLVNIEGTRNLVFNNIDNLPIVFASTGSVYGAVEGVCTEETKCNTKTAYGMQKLAAEKILQEKGNTLILRFATAFGVSPCMRVNLLVNDLVYQALTNRTITVFEPNARRTFIHLKDMADSFRLGLEKLVEKKLSRVIYNAGSNELNLTKKEIVEKIQKKTGCYVTYYDFDKDLDQRDYQVDYGHFEREIMTCKINVDKGIDELVKAVPLLRVLKYEYQ